MKHRVGATLLTTFNSDPQNAIFSGRLRPDFLARCKWDKVLQACTGYYLVAFLIIYLSTKPLRKTKTILDGRKSFPSGHSSTAFSGMTFLALWLAGNTAAWCFGSTKPPGSLRSSRLGCLLLTLLPLSWATFVAISRMEDYVRILTSNYKKISLNSRAETPQGRYSCRQCHWYCFSNSIISYLLAKSLLCNNLCPWFRGKTKNTPHKRGTWKTRCGISTN